MPTTVAGEIAQNKISVQPKPAAEHVALNNKLVPRTFGPYKHFNEVARKSSPSATGVLNFMKLYLNA